MATTAAAIPATARPRRLYIGLALLAIAIVTAGFWRTYFGRLVAGTVEVPAIIHFHASIYVGWLALFLTQTVLAATGRVALHIKLGRLAIGYGVLVIATGLLAAFGMFLLRVRAGQVAEAQSALVGPLLDMLAFAPVFAAAVYYRRKPQLHKRLMVVAATLLLIAAVGRIPFPAELRSLLVIYVVWASPILVAMAHDFWRESRVHAAYVIGLVLLLAEGRPTRALIRGSDAWLEISGRLATWLT